MKAFKLLSVLALVLLMGTPTLAQRRGPSKEDVEKFRAKKIAFLSEALQLTPDEAEKFWPVYNQAEKENWEAQNKRREIEEKVQQESTDMSDKEIVALTKERVNTYRAEADVIEKYNKKFLEVLPPKKVLILYQAEHQFLRKMLHEFRSRRLNENDTDN